MNSTQVRQIQMFISKIRFPKRSEIKTLCQKYLDADEKLSGVSLKIDYYEVMLKYIEEILKQITNRTYQIKNSIDYMRFTSGAG